MDETPNSPPLGHRQSMRSLRSVRSSASQIFSDANALPEMDLGSGEGRSSLARASESERRIQRLEDRRNSDSEGLHRSLSHSRLSQKPHTGQPARMNLSRLSRTLSTAKRPPHTSTSAAEGRPPSFYRSSRTTSLLGNRAQSPYQGATGPSHPYAQYSQDTTVSRTSSSTTGAAPRRETSFRGPTGPTQPYAMYSQNTVPDEDDQDPFNDYQQVSDTTFNPSSTSAPQTYLRRLGPDREDADDLVGPMGYTEQLPPYTRYPNDIPPKRDPDANSFVNGNVPPMPGPSSAEPASTEEAPQPQRAASLQRRSQTSPTPSPAPAPHNPFDDEHAVQPDSPAESELLSKEDGSSFSEKMKRRTRKHVCWGVMPCWVFVIVVFAIMVAILVGGIIGGLVAKSHTQRFNHTHHPTASATASPAAASSSITSISPAQTPEDAAPLSSSISSLPAIPTGSFSVTLDNPTSTTNSCLTDMQQIDAWDCSTGAALDITIKSDLGQLQSPVIAITFPQPATQIRYGAQPPQFTGLASMSLMEDKVQPNRGLAFTFQQQFNKTVIIRAENLIGAMKEKKKRSWDIFNSGWTSDVVEENVVAIQKRQRGKDSDWTMGEYAVIGDRPWVCHWNGTVLDGFIYVDQDVVTGPGGSASPSNSAAAAATSSALYRFRRRDWLDERQAPPSSSTSTPGASPPPSSAGSHNPAYPKLVKIEERRAPNNPVQPYCQQMIVQADANNFLQMLPLTHPDGSFNLVNLTEVESPRSTLHQNQYVRLTPGNGQGKKGSKEKRVPTNRCQCVWANT